MSPTTAADFFNSARSAPYRFPSTRPSTTMLRASKLARIRPLDPTVHFRLVALKKPHVYALTSGIENPLLRTGFGTGNKLIFFSRSRLGLPTSTPAGTWLEGVSGACKVARQRFREEVEYVLPNPLTWFCFQVRAVLISLLVDFEETALETFMSQEFVLSTLIKIMGLAPVRTDTADLIQESLVELTERCGLRGIATKTNQDPPCQNYAS